MLNNPGTERLYNGQPIYQGTPIYDINGDKLGDVSEHGIQGDTLVMHKGMFFQKDVYIPLSVIQRADANGVYLSVTKDQLNDMDTNGPEDDDDNVQTRPAGETVVETNRTAGYADLGDRDLVTGAPARTETEEVDVVRTPGATAATPRTADTLRSRDTVVTPGATESVDIPVREETLAGGKTSGQIGDVHVHKDVVTEHRTASVPLTHDEATVEHVAPDPNAKNLGDDAFREQDIDIPLMGEKASSSKSSRVVDEIRVSKQPVTEEEQVSGDVRRERVQVEGIDETPKNPTVRP